MWVIAKLFGIITMRWCIALISLLLGIWAIIGNYFIVIKTYITKKWESLIPLVGGILSAIGIAVLPLNSVNKLWWIPLLIDIGCVPILIYTLVYRLFFHRRKI